MINSTKTVVKLLFVLTFIITLNTNAQSTFTGNPDSAFKVARTLAFNKERKKAQDTLLLILTKYPNYHDVRSFLATTYSWDGEYQKARVEFSHILKKAPKRKTTWVAAINNELWANKPFKALELVNKALKYFPNDTDILYLRAKAEENTNKPEEALSTLQELIKTNPENKKAKDYKNRLVNSLSRNTVGIRSEVEIYSKTFDPMQYHAFKLGRNTKYGSIIARVNFNRRFQENGVQFEVDMYPKISKGFYAYLNVGFSNSFLFPDVRYGAELYKSLPRGFEMSLGFRALKYDTTTTIYTGSVGWYTGNSYWSFRPYITPNDAGTSFSGALNYRRYRNDADNYFSIVTNVGYSPEINQFIFGGNANTIVNLNSQKLRLGYYFTSSNKQNAWGVQSGISHQEIIFDPGNYFWVYSFILSWELKFR